MSESPLSEFIKPHKLARKTAKLHRTVQVSALPGLSGLAADGAGAVEASLSFDINDEGFSVVEGRATVELSVSCQRCLEPLILPLQSSIRLLFIDTQTRDGKQIDVEQYQARFEGRYEIYPVEDEQVNLYDLLEQELLLEMPIVPVHEQCEALPPALPETPATEVESKRRENPFSVLGQLKDKFKTSHD